MDDIIRRIRSGEFTERPLPKKPGEPKNFVVPATVTLNAQELQAKFEDWQWERNDYPNQVKSWENLRSLIATENSQKREAFFQAVIAEIGWKDDPMSRAILDKCSMGDGHEDFYYQVCCHETIYDVWKAHCK